MSASRWRGRELVEGRGWRYEVWSEPPEAELGNLRFLAGFRRDWLFAQRLLDQLRTSDFDGMPLGKACRSLASWPEPLARSAIFHLLWTHHFTVDLTRPLSASHVLANGGPVMTRVNVPVGVGARFLYDGDLFEVVEMSGGSAGNDVLLRAVGGQRGLLHVSLRELLVSEQACVVPDLPGPSSDDARDPASVVLAGLTESEKEAALERAAHVREVLTGYRSGSAELAGADKPRAQFDPCLPLTTRYESQAAELGISLRTIKHRGLCPACGITPDVADVMTTKHFPPSAPRRTDRVSTVLAKPAPHRMLTPI